MSVTLLVSGMFDHKAQAANHKPQNTNYKLQTITRNPQPTTHNPQPTTHNSQPTTHNPQRITEVKCDVNADPKKCPGPDEVTLYAKGVTCDV